jgi:hypothetical protein
MKKLTMNEYRNKYKLSEMQIRYRRDKGIIEGVKNSLGVWLYTDAAPTDPELDILKQAKLDNIMTDTYLKSLKGEKRIDEIKNEAVLDYRTREAFAFEKLKENYIHAGNKADNYFESVSIDGYAELILKIKEVAEMESYSNQLTKDLIKTKTDLISFYKDSKFNSTKDDPYSYAEMLFDEVASFQNDCDLSMLNADELGELVENAITAIENLKHVTTLLGGLAK